MCATCALQLRSAHSTQLNRIHTVERAHFLIYVEKVERTHLLIYAEIVERAYLIIYSGIVERAYLITQWAGISGYDVISDMTSLAASLCTLDLGGGGNLLMRYMYIYIYHAPNVSLNIYLGIYSDLVTISREGI